MPLGDGTGPYWAKQIETKQQLYQGYGSGQRRSFWCGFGSSLGDRKGQGFRRRIEQNHRFGNQNPQYISQMNDLVAMKHEISKLKSGLNENQPQHKNK